MESESRRPGEATANNGNDGNNLVSPNSVEVQAFLAWQYPHVHVCCIKTGEPLSGRYFGADVEAATQYVVERNQAGLNCYFTFNIPTPDCGVKPSKKQIIALRGVHVDIDPPKGGTLNKAEVCAALEAHSPNLVVDSGNGIHAYWLFPEPIEATPENVEAVEAVNRALIAKFNGDKAASNVDRIMRIPGTVNWKRDRRMAKTLFRQDGFRPALDALQAHFAPPATPAPETPARPSEGLSVGDSEVLARLMADPALAALWNGDLSGHGGDHSAADQALCNALAPRTNFNPAQVERIWLASPLGQREKTQSRQDYRERTINKAMDSRRDFALVDSSKLTAEIAAKVEGNQPRFKLYTPDELKLLPPMQWRVKGVFPKQGFGIIYGPSGSGKSFLAFDMICAIAEGEPWFGHRTKPAPVLYVGLEGEAGVSQRVLAWEQAHGRPVPTGMRFLLQPFRLAHAEDVAALGSVCGYSEPVIIIDTLSPASPGLDENSSKDMGAVIEGANALQRLTGGLVVLIAHTGKDFTKGIRGHSSLFAALDGAILVSGNGTRRTWKVDKAKDAEAGQEFGFVLKVCTVGRDEDGEGITSLVVEPDEVAVSTPQQRPLSPNQKLALSTFHTAAGECGQLVNNAFAGLHLNDWRPAFYRESTADNDDNKKKAFQRAREALVERGELSVANDIYRLAGPNAAETEKVIAARLREAGQRDIIGTSPGHVPRRDTP
ncbi:AAA family ATPase [Glycocaulis abyssi]|uniref:AAA family ATPase n=1 Tax=Glycocaulis abyssi TaxID=1433403 RepID=A0ABV9NGZ6_9PROT